MEVHAFARALIHPLRRQILEGMPENEAVSPSDLAERFDVSLGVTAYHVRKLAVMDLIELERTVPRRGAVEHYYRRTAGVGDALKSLEKLATSLEGVGVDGRRPSARSKSKSKGKSRRGDSNP